MPQVMTPEEAKAKTCPFMTRRINDPQVYDEAVRCLADKCACWGWFDDERGNVTGVQTEDFVEDAAPTNPPEGHVWRRMYKVNLYINEGKNCVKGHKWQLLKILGPRRGQCEAMSPHIEVTP